MKSGTYVIKCIPTCKMYIGSAASGIKDRLWHHVGRLRRGIHYNTHLQRAWNKYGEESFVLMPLESHRKEDCISSEQSLLDFYWDSGFLFNIMPKADSPLGRKHSEKTKAKISAAHMGKVGSWNGRKHSEETKAKISAANKGQNKGGTLPRSTIEKILAARAGYRHSQETREKIGKSNIGKTHSLESRRKVSETKRNRNGKFTEVDVASIRKRYIPGDPVHGQNALAREFQVSRCAIQRILKGVR